MCRSHLCVNLFVVYFTLSQTNFIPVCMVSCPTILVDPNQHYDGLVSRNTASNDSAISALQLRRRQWSLPDFTVLFTILPIVWKD
jgi:hypothetical protein